MNYFRKRCISTLVALCILLGCGENAHAAGNTEFDTVSSETAAYICSTVKHPQIGSVGGEWAVLGLARLGYDVPDGYYREYYRAVETYVTACGGVLHTRKYTEYSRVIIALTAIGKDPADVAGYNLLTALGDYDKTVWQGLNGPIWALIALDCGSYDMPLNPAAKTQATREKYIEAILSKQLSDGGFSLTGDGSAEPCITAMALQALSNYTYRSDVAACVKKALNCLSAMQNADAGFLSGGTEDSESCAQVIIALCELGISPEDPRFVKNGNTLLDNLLSFYLGGGGFAHTHDGREINQMATEQAMLALVAVRRAADGKSGILKINDSVKSGEISGSVWSAVARRSLISRYRNNASAWEAMP